MNLSYCGSTLLGLFIAIVANFLHLHSMFIVKVNPIHPGDVLFLRGVVQTVGFGIVLLLQKCSNYKVSSTAAIYDNLESQQMDQPTMDVKFWITMTFCNILVAATVILTFMAIDLLPLSDFTMLAFTTPMFTMLFSFIILK